MDTHTKLRWPDMTRDNRAWELAKIALGERAPLTDLLARAQQIKQALKAEGLR